MNISQLIIQNKLQLEHGKIEEAQLEQRKKLLDLKKKTAVALKKVTLIGKKQTLV